MHTIKQLLLLPLLLLNHPFSNISRNPNRSNNLHSPVIPRNPSHGNPIIISLRINNMLNFIDNASQYIMDITK